MGGACLRDNPEWSPATDANHLNQCIEFASGDGKLWAAFTQRISDNKPKAAGIWGRYWPIILPTLTLATLLCEAYEEAR